MAESSEPARSAHPPAQPHAESREETLDRVLAESEQVGGDAPRAADPSTRRGFNEALGRQMLRGAIVGAVAGVVIAVLLRWVAPAPLTGWPGGRSFSDSELVNWVGWTLALAVALAIVMMVIAAFLHLAREDGRIEREVERATGHRPEGPGRPLGPEHDVREPGASR